MKKYAKTALGLVLSLGIISSATNANALWGMFEDKEDTLKEERRTPVLNNSAGYVTPPDPNLIYGSMPTNPEQDLLAQGQLAPMPLQNPEFMPIPQNLGQEPLQPIAMPAMPEPPQMIPQMMPPQIPQVNNVVDNNGYPQLNAIPQMPPAPMQNVPTINPRAEMLKADLQTSNQLAAQNGYAPMAAADVAINNPTPEFLPMPPAPPVFMPQQVATAAPAVEPVFPSGPSVTVRSKRAQGFTPQMPQPIPQQVAMQSFQPMPEVVPAPMAHVETAMIAPAIMPEKFVTEANAPVASSYDNPNDNWAGFNGLSNGSYTVASNNSNRNNSFSGFVSSRHPVILSQSRYANYRKTGNK